MDKNKELRLWKDYLMMKWEEGCSLPFTHCDCDEPKSFACWKKHLSSDEYKVIKKGFSKWIFQNHFAQMNFTHRIDIEPSPSQPLSYPELCERLRLLLFKMNKKHLKSRVFSKWKPEDKFWVMGFQEGDVKGDKHQLHYHLMLHSPKNHDADVWNDLYWKWMVGEGTKHNSNKRKKVFYQTKDTFHFASESLVEHPYFQVQKIRNKVGSTKYASKKMHFDDYDNHFFIGFDEKRNTDKELMKMRQK